MITRGLLKAASVFRMGYTGHAGPEANAGFSFIYEIYFKHDTKRAIMSCSPIFGGAAPLQSRFGDPTRRKIIVKTEKVSSLRNLALVLYVYGQPALIFPAPNLHRRRSAPKDPMHHHVSEFKRPSPRILGRRRNGRWPLRMIPIKPALLSNKSFSGIGVEWVNLLFDQS